MDNPILALLADRHATRSIAPQPVDDTILGELLEAARLAPSCFNKQPWRMVLATSEQGRATVCAALRPGNASWACRAPALLVLASAPNEDCQLPDGRNYYQFDLGLAAMNIMLAATARGLVARPMAGFDLAALEEALALKAEPMVVLAIGTPDPDEGHLPEELRGKGAQPRERRPLEELVRRI